MLGELNEMVPTEKDALYYPYIHIRSVDWLKRALLIFPHVARIVPDEFYTRDFLEIMEFEKTFGRRNKPLLRNANLRSPGVRNAQRTLLKLLADDIKNKPGFLKRYGGEMDDNDSYRHRIKNRQDEFLLHPNKPMYELVHFLKDNGLMWHARFADTSADTAVHPAIGETIMSTLAMACAQDEGFDVVTDDGRVHQHISESNVANLYRLLIRGNTSKATHKVTEKKLCELIVFQQCDASKLTPNALAELSNDREAIDAFRIALANIAEKIPEMQDTAAFEDRLRGAVDDALLAWIQDRMNMGNVSKEIFGRELLKPTEGFVKGLVEKFAPPVIGAAGGGASAGVGGILVGAAGGFVVALLIHGLTSWSKAAERAKNSPFRYLTQIEKAGVAFTIAS